MKAKILCWLLASVMMLCIFGVSAVEAPVWWYVICICIAILCVLLIHAINPKFWVDPKLKE